MITKVIDAVYANSDDIRPAGIAERHDDGSHKRCPKCLEGITFFDFDTRKIKCTRCDFVKE